MRRALAALLFALAGCGPAPQGDGAGAAPAAPAPSPVTPAHNGGRFQVEIGRSFDVVLDPNIPPTRAWRLAEAPSFIQHLPPAGGHPLGGAPPQTAAFTFFASSLGEGELVFTEPYGSQFRVSIVAAQTQPASPPDPLSPGAVIQLNSVARGGRVDVGIGQRMAFHASVSGSRGEVVEPSELPRFIEYLGVRDAHPDEPANWGGSSELVYSFVARSAGEGELVIQEYDQREGGQYEVFRATIVAR